MAGVPPFGQGPSSLEPEGTVQDDVSGRSAGPQLDRDRRIDCQLAKPDRTCGLGGALAGRKRAACDAVAPDLSRRRAKRGVASRHGAFPAGGAAPGNGAARTSPTLMPRQIITTANAPSSPLYSQ